MASIKLKNLDRLLKRMNNVKGMDITQALQRATLLVEGEAKNLAPVDTGNLRASIHPEIKKKGQNSYGRVYTACEYAPMVEFGTGIKGNGSYPYEVEGLSYRDTPWTYTKDGGDTFYKTKGQVAKPFLYPALKNNEKKIKKMIEEDIKTLIDKNLGG